MKRDYLATAKAALAATKATRTADLTPELALAEQRLAPDGPGWLPWQTAALGAVVLVRDDRVEAPEPYSDLVRNSRAELVQLYADQVSGADLKRVHLVKTIFGGRVVAGEA